jgi:hypothetical protein
MHLQGNCHLITTPTLTNTTKEENKDLFDPDSDMGLRYKLKTLLARNSYYSTLIDRLTSNHQRMLYRRVEHHALLEQEKCKALQARIHEIATKRFTEKRKKRKQEFMANLATERAKATASKLFSRK